MCVGGLFVLFLTAVLLPIFNLLRSSVNLQEKKIVFMSSIFFFPKIYFRKSACREDRDGAEGAE